MLDVQTSHLLKAMRKVGECEDSLRTTFVKMQHQLTLVGQLPVQAATAALESHNRHMGILIESWTRQLIEPALRFARWTQEQEPRMHESLEALAERGWYLDPDISLGDIPWLASFIGEDPEAFDTNMAEFIREGVNGIRTRLMESYPNRAPILADAFDAHGESRYSLAIPVFLAQADGFFQDSMSGKSLFVSGERKSAVEEHHSSGFDTVLLLPLQKSLPIWQSRAERGEAFHALNRHQVLHGESLDYGTEENSLKAISLLSYLSWVLRSP